MSEERSVTDFSADEEADSGPNESEKPSSGIEPATVTYRWRPEGSVCAQCGATTEKQWFDGDRFVCPDCKRWE